MKVSGSINDGIIYIQKSLKVKLKNVLKDDHIIIGNKKFTIKETDN